MPDTRDADILAGVLRSRRSVRDFLADPIPADVLDAVLADACQAPSWSNTQPYRIAVASGDRCVRLRDDLTRLYDKATRARDGGWWRKLGLALLGEGMPDGDFKTNFEYPAELQPRRRATGHGLYGVLGIGRGDHAAREAQMRRNFEFFGAPTVLFIFVHGGLREFSILDAGLFLQTLLLSAHAHGLASCAQGALATWAGPVRRVFEVPPGYKLICGVALGYASSAPVNAFNPGRVSPPDLLLPTRI